MRARGYVFRFCMKFKVNLYVGITLIGTDNLSYFEKHYGYFYKNHTFQPIVPMTATYTRDYNNRYILKWSDKITTDIWD